LSLLPIFSGIDKNKSVSHNSTVSSEKTNVSPKQVVVEPAIERAAARRVAVHGAFSTPSILDALKDEPKTQEKVGITGSATNQNSKGEEVNPFSQQDLLEAWRSFVATIEAPQLKSALSAREPVLADKWQIDYELDTELQFNRLTLDLKPKLQGQLRRSLKNELIEIQFKVSAVSTDQPNIPYTDAERWNALAEKYPALATLKSKFGLDFEHF
jgi:DNA polymerase-3 subunit gamma/tau